MSDNPSMEPFKYKIAIYGSRRQEDSLTQLPQFFKILNDLGFRVYIFERFAEYLESNEVETFGAVPALYLPPEVSLVISLGGDGTFLRTARWIGNREIPIMGVNTGHLGFLSCCALDGVKEMIDNICKGNVEVEKRMLIKIEHPGLPDNIWPYALNEITFLREGSSIISAKASIDGNFLADYRGDGLIVSTPTGSTAYSLSAGGPVIQPTIDCICLCPVAPHTLALRPLVAGSDSMIEVQPQSRSGNFTLTIDNRSVVLPCEGSFKISKASFSVLLIRKKGTGFASILREKLLWSATP